MSRPSVLLVACLLWSAAASAQVTIAGYNVVAERQERVGENHGFLFGSVEIEQGDTKLYADVMEIFENDNRVLARGNVLLIQAGNRLAADHAEFNTRTRLGTFYRASGIASIQPPRQNPQPGAVAIPQVAGQDTDVYFFGDTIEKIGTKKYKITNGGFSTCVQPTPRWDLSAGTVILNVDDYTLLRQAILRVKGVPMLYLPWMYYPTKEDGRATGFLIPTYGMSSIRGQTIHNAFFWAINRSHDATILHDWFSRTGTGTGAEYRFDRGGGSDGAITTYFLDQRNTTYQLSGGGTASQPAERSYTIAGTANQRFPFRMRGRARVNYFSSIRTNQTFNTNVNDAARNNRNFGGNIVGSWGSYTMNTTFERSEWFNSQTNSGVTGSSPRIAVTRSERPVFENARLYFAVNSEAAHLDRITNNSDGTKDDRSLGRLDLNPSIRYPFTRWPWFTVNSSLSWRNTFYTRSLDATRTRAVRDSLSRQLFTASAQATGPVFTKVWDTADSSYAERFKHTIEPYVNIQRTSSFDDFDRIVQIDGTDLIVGGTTTVAYGVNNRIYAKRREGSTSRAQEIVSVEIAQSYYTRALASIHDPTYNSGANTRTPSTFSGITTNVRVTPTADINGTMRVEVDGRTFEAKTISANTNVTLARRVTTTLGWTHKFFIESLPEFSNPATLDHYLNLASSVRTTDNKYGALYSLNYDVLRSRLLQQRMTAFYNAQCCGIAFEYQKYNLAGVASSALPADHRFFLSFTLAGLGNFSPFSGGLMGVPR